MPPKKKKNTWANSDGRRLLRSDIRNRRITDDMQWQDVFQRRPEFAFETNHAEAERLFQKRLATARAYVRKKEERAAEELALFQQDRLVYPVNGAMYSGEPRWEGSEAQRLLKQDVANGLPATMTRDEFYESRGEYQDYSKATIIGHIFQEESTEKFLTQYRARYGVDNNEHEYNSDDAAADEDDDEDLFDYDDDDEGKTDTEDF